MRPEGYIPVFVHINDMCIFHVSTEMNVITLFVACNIVVAWTQVARADT